MMNGMIYNSTIPYQQLPRVLLYEKRVRVVPLNQYPRAIYGDSDYESSGRAVGWAADSNGGSMDDKNLKEKALADLNDRQVEYLLTESKFAELKALLSELEDSIVILPCLGITQSYSSIMKDKMVMYEAQIKAFRALYKYLVENIIGPNDESIITRRGTQIE